MNVRLLVSLIVASSVALTACGSDDEDEPTTATSPESNTGSQPADGTLGEPESTSFAFATGGVGFSWVGVMSTIDQLNQAGWDIETPELSASELQVEGTARGEFQMSAGSTNGALLATQAGFPVTMVTERVKTEWTLYSKSELDSCEALDGVTLAIHSEGSPATFMVQNWIEENCPDIEPNYLIMPGSENRYAALLSGEIDASPIELSDAISLEAEGGDDFTRLASFAEDLPDLRTTNVYGNPEWMAENPNTVATFIATLLTEYRKYAEDPAYLEEQALEYIPGVNPDTLGEVAAAYAELAMFDPDGGVSQESQEYTIEFFVEAGLIEDGLKPADAFDRSYLEAALASL